MNKSPIDIIAENLPTFCDLYSNPQQIEFPSKMRLAKDAASIIAALAKEGFEITRKIEKE